MNVLIVDDEKKARETISEIIRLYCSNEIKMSQAEGVASALAAIDQAMPDLLLLDIHLKDGNGFDILNRIKNDSIHVIFITAYEEYAIQACRASALDYILKPVDPDEITRAVTKAQQKVKKEKLAERIDVFLQNISEISHEIKKITLKTADSIHIVAVADIVFCEGSGNYTTFHLLDRQKIMVSKPLGEYEEMIGSNKFIRTHQSFLVNLDHVTRYEKGDGGFIITKNNDSIPVSTRKKEQVMQFLNNL